MGRIGWGRSLREGCDRERRERHKRSVQLVNSEEDQERAATCGVGVQQLKRIGLTWTGG